MYNSLDINRSEEMLPWVQMDAGWVELRRFPPSVVKRLYTLGCCGWLRRCYAAPSACQENVSSICPILPPCYFPVRCQLIRLSRHAGPHMLLQPSFSRNTDHCVRFAKSFTCSFAEVYVHLWTSSQDCEGVFKCEVCPEVVTTMLPKWKGFNLNLRVVVSLSSMLSM